MSKEGSTTLRQHKSLNSLPLEEVIQRLRGGLLESAWNRPKGFKPMFKVTEATVELAVSFQRSVKAGGKLNIFVAEIGSEGSEASSASHRIALKLVPLDRDMITSDEDAAHHTYQGKGKR